MACDVAALRELVSAGRVEEARDRCRAHCRDHPDDLEAWHLLGLINSRLGDYPASAACYDHLLEIAPRDPMALYNRGKLHGQEGRWREAAGCLRAAVQQRPDFSEAWAGLGNMLYNLLELQEAETAFRHALAAQPAFGDPRCYLEPPAGRNGVSAADMWRAHVHSCLGRVQRKLGQLDEAFDSYQQALKLRPDDAVAHTNLLFLMSYHVLCSPEVTLAAHEAWDKVHGTAGRAARFIHERTGEDGKRLKIGYVSPHLCRHVVNFFFEPLLAHHDHEAVEVYCYAEVRHPDAVTARLQSHADHWRSTVGMSDAQVAAMIHGDGIDVLIDLAGHTTSSRLKVFTYKPAPVQATYLGYCNTSGLEAMDYWITDENLHPADTEELAAETLYRLPRCWLCYRPDPGAPPVTVPPARPVTFGCLNDLSKVSPQVVALWSDILRAVPDSRLLLKTWLLASGESRDRVREQFAAHGIEAGRLELLPQTEDYLGVYHDIDIALDPFPRTGGATTADALWMGVPVVTLAGRRYIDRQGVSLLRAVGLDELVATSPRDYVDRAVALARDPERRRALRATQRERMAASPLCDGRGLARALETAYRDMWRNWLEGGEHAG
ncbi:MAG TPA: tetratricopeptide repeat protein [Gammaproteobacteria bacterium]|nr:tetratricopeptide repeat protein [Gammaproteobacteria bacterium]